MVRQANEGQLLRRIQSIRTTQQGNQHQASLLQSTFAECLQRCQSPSCMRQDFDDLGQWALAAKSLAVASPTHVNTLASLLDYSTQSRLTQLFWNRLGHDRASVVKRCESVLPMILSLLDQVAVLQPSTSNSPHSHTLPLSHLASLLLDRASQDMETRTALVVYDNLLSLYDATEVLRRTPDLYSQLINKFSAHADVPTRRARVCMKILRRHGEALDLRFEALTVNGVQQTIAASEAWTAWIEYTTQPIIDALESCDSYRRTSTSVYHLVELLQLAPASILAITAGLLRDDKASQNLPAILATLRAARIYGLCRVGNKVVTDNETMLGGDVTLASHKIPISPLHRPCIVVPVGLLTACGQSSEEELQVSAFSLVVESKSAVSPLTKDEFVILYAFLEASFSSTHASGRGSLHSLFGKLLARATAVGYAAEREIVKVNAYAPVEKLETRITHQAALQLIRDFLKSVKEMLLGALHPGAPYHIVIASLTFLDLLLAAGVDSQYERSGPGDTDAGLKATFGTFRKDYSLGVPLIDGRMVQILLSCADSTYPDVQSRALGLLHRFPAPLHSIEEQAVAERVILLKAKRLLLSGRDSESSAAGCLLRVYQQIYIRRLGWAPVPLLQLDASGSELDPTAPAHSRELLLFSDLLVFLDAQITIAEEQGLYTAAKSNPLHGSLTTLQKMLDDPLFWAAAHTDHDVQEELRTAFLQARALIDRIWHVTRPILCAAVPEGNDHLSQGTAFDVDDRTDTADTEVARALAAAEGSSLDEHLTDTIMRNSQMMLSYAWRGMKEAAALLGKLVTSPLKHDAQLAQVIWRRDEIEEVGSRFILWMTAVRHRGAFSTIYPAYSSAAGAIVRSDWPQIEHLPKDWLQSFISMITDAQSSISTTRRSAGIGYAVLALISALPLRQDRAPLDSAMKQLIQAADDCFGSEDLKIVAAHIHTINILRVLVLDASIAHSMAPFTDTLLSLSIRRFQSPTWYIRNAGLMLFAALSPRAFPTRRTNEDAPSSQLPAHRFFQMYPTLYPTLKTHLKRALERGLHKAVNRADAEQAGSLYAVLFLLSRVQAVDHQESEAEDLEALKNLVGQCLESADFKVREIASRAYSSLTTTSRSLPTALDLLAVCQSTSRQNLLHGSLLAIARLGRNHCAIDGRQAIALALRSLPENLSHHSPAVRDAHRKALTEHEAANAPPNGKVIESPQDAVRRLRHVLWGHAERVCPQTIASSTGKDVDESFVQPIIDSLFAPGLNNPTQKIMNHCFYGLFATLLSLLIGTSGNPHVLFLNLVAVGLWASVNWFVAELAKIDGSPSEDQSATSDDFQVRSEAADDLYESYDESIYLSNLTTDGTTLEEEWNRLASVVFSSGKVPLRESALTLLGCLTTSSLNTSKDAIGRNKILAIYSKMVCLCAREQEHVESRLAAIQSLARCGTWLFSDSQHKDQELVATDRGVERALFNARVAVLNLLQDDEEEVRYIAAELLSKTLSLCPLTTSGTEVASDFPSSSKQLDALLQTARGSVASSSISTVRAWKWMGERYCNGSRAAGKDLWTRYLCCTVICPPERDLASSLKEALYPPDVLFVTEPPNLYRDVEVDVLRALHDLSTDRNFPATQRWLQARRDGVVEMAKELLEREETTASIVGRLLAVRLYATAKLMGAEDGEVRQVKQELAKRLRYV